MIVMGRMMILNRGAAVLTKNEHKIRRLKYRKSHINKYGIDHVRNLKNINSKINRKNKPWIKTYGYILTRISRGKRGIKEYKIYKNINNYLNCDDLKYLWFRDKAFEMIKPSIDRINPDEDYTIENCRYIECQENIKRRRTRARKIKRISKNNKYKIFNSAREALKAIGKNIKSTGIYYCCRGITKNSYGYRWEYASEIYLQEENN